MEVFAVDATTLFVDDMLIFKLSFGFVLGALLVLTGVGGGVLLIPVLQVGFGMSAILAVGTASLIVTFVKFQAAYTHIRHKNVEWLAVKWLLLSATPLALITSQVIVSLNASEALTGYINSAVEWLVVFVMITALYSLMIDMKTRTKTKCHKSVEQKRTNALYSGAIGGTLLGSTGIGGGVVLLPLLSGPIGVNMRKAIGSSVIISLCLSLVTAISYSSGSLSDISTAILIVMGALAGIPVAAHIMKRLSEKQLYVMTLSIIIASLVTQLSTLF